MTAASSQSRLFCPELPGESKANLETDQLLLDWLNAQYRPVTLSEIHSPPFTTLTIGDLLEVGGLGIPKASLRSALSRLEQKKRILRLDPPRGSCAPLYVAL